MIREGRRMTLGLTSWAVAVEGEAAEAGEPALTDIAGVVLGTAGALLESMTPRQLRHTT